MFRQKAICLILLGIAVILVQSPAFSSEPAGFAGQWKLNARESDDPRKKFEEAFEKSSRAEQDEKKKEGKPPEHKENKLTEKTAGPFDPPDTITILSSPDTVKISDSRGNDRTYYTDGRKTSQTMGKGRTMTFVAGWEDDAFVIRTQGPDGGPISETYYLSQDGTQLYVKLQMHPFFVDQPITIIRVYDPAPPQSQTQSQPAM